MVHEPKSIFADSNSISPNLLVRHSHPVHQGQRRNDKRRAANPSSCDLLDGLLMKVLTANRFGCSLPHYFRLTSTGRATVDNGMISVMVLGATFSVQYTPKARKMFCCYVSTCCKQDIKLRMEYCDIYMRKHNFL